MKNAYLIIRKNGEENMKKAEELSLMVVNIEEHIQREGSFESGEKSFYNMCADYLKRTAGLDIDNDYITSVAIVLNNFNDYRMKRRYRWVAEDYGFNLVEINV